MTRDELREKVARAILIERFFETDRHNYVDVDEFWQLLDDDHKYDASNEADAVLDTIFAALKEPTDEMSDAGVKSDVLLSAIIDWQGSYTPKEDVASDIWELMLSASPLAPKGKEE